MSILPHQSLAASASGRRPGGEMARPWPAADKTAAGFGAADFHRRAKT